MIERKSDYKRYLKMDAFSCNVNIKKSFNNELFRYQKLMRKLEYYSNCKKDIISKILIIFMRIRYKRKSIKYGFSIPINTFGPGLNIMHRGTIVVNGNARIGENCKINADVNIGTQMGTRTETPTIGNNCYIGPGAKIFGKIKIGDNVAIGANAFVNKDFPDGVTIAGVPAKIVSNKGTWEAYKRFRQNENVN